MARWHSRRARTAIAREGARAYADAVATDADAASQTPVSGSARSGGGEEAPIAEAEMVACSRIISISVAAEDARAPRGTTGPTCTACSRRRTAAAAFGRVAHAPPLARPALARKALSDRRSPERQSPRRRRRPRPFAPTEPSAEIAAAEMQRDATDEIGADCEEEEDRAGAAQ